MDQGIYYELREFLDGLPGGFPATDSGVEIKILKKLFTPKEARMVMNLSAIPETPEAVAQRCGMPEHEVADKLAAMSRRGLVHMVTMWGESLFMALQYEVGIYEYQLGSMDRELAELAEEYLPHLDTFTDQFRVVPVGSDLDTRLKPETYDRVRELIKNKEIISLAPCICRRKQGLLGYDCDRPEETCLSFESIAEHFIECGMGKRITAEEAYRTLDLAEESSLVLLPSNAQEISTICCCCGCCCDVLRNLKSFARPAEQIQSSFQARIEPETCSSCGLCIDRCQMDAIGEHSGIVEVIPERCIGCGLCVSGCPDEAINLIPKGELKAPPADMLSMMMTIAKGRGIG